MAAEGLHVQQIHEQTDSASSTKLPSGYCDISVPVYATVKGVSSAAELTYHRERSFCYGPQSFKMPFFLQHALYSSSPIRAKVDRLAEGT